MIESKIDESNEQGMKLQRKKIRVNFSSNAAKIGRFKNSK